MDTLAVYLFGHNLEKIRYPYLESIESALDLTRFVNGQGAVYYGECDSIDDSLLRITTRFNREIANGELNLRRHPWGDHHTIQAYICNFLLNEIGTRYEFALKLDADEVIHEASFEAFRHDLGSMALRRVPLGRPTYTHFCPDFGTTFPFIYDSKAVLSRTHAGLRYDTGKGGDACALGGGAEWQTRLQIMHYGKVHTGRMPEALEKERSFQELYTELGFPDPKVKAQWEQGYLDYMRVFDVAASRGEFQPFSGTHPRYMTDYIQAALERQRAFDEQVAA